MASRVPNNLCVASFYRPTAPSQARWDTIRLSRELLLECVVSANLSRHDTVWDVDSVWKVGIAMEGQARNRGAVATWIVETARARAETIAQAPIAGELELLGCLDSLSTQELQSLSVRLGRYAWNRRLDDVDLLTISQALLQAQSTGVEGLAPEYRASLSALGALIKALGYRDEGPGPRCEPSQIEEAVRAVWTQPPEQRQVVDTPLVRSILEPLLAGDRAAFRTLLATLGSELVTLAAMGTDGRLTGVTGFYGYAQVRTLHDALNGVLLASRG
jgi:hypothetical protein